MAVEKNFPGLLVAAGVPTLLILTDQAVLGAATLAVVLLAWVAHATLTARAAQPRAQLTVLPELRQRVPADDEDDLFNPDDPARPWVRLWPSEY